MNNTLEKENADENLNDSEKETTINNNYEEFNSFLYGRVKWDNEKKQWVKLKT